MRNVLRVQAKVKAPPPASAAIQALMAEQQAMQARIAQLFAQLQREEDTGSEAAAAVPLMADSSRESVSGSPVPKTWFATRSLHTHVVPPPPADYNPFEGQDVHLPDADTPPASA